MMEDSVVRAVFIEKSGKRSWEGDVDASKIRKLLPKSSGRMILCPDCQSARVMSIKIDSDWAMGIGSYKPANGDSFYKPEDLKLESWNRPDIDMHHCLDCQTQFE